MKKAPQTTIYRTSSLRTRPTQARSQKTFDAILAAAADLLIDVGWDGFNTNLLAERAGCRVATLYRYFPDKLAVISTLAESVVAQWDLAFAEIATAFEGNSDLREVWPEFSSRFVTILKTDPSALAVRKAMHAVPELRAIDQEDNKRLAEHLAAIFRAKLPSVAAERSLSVARVLIESQVAVTDLAMTETDEEATRLLHDLETMHLAFLNQLYANYQKPSGGSGNA